MKFILFLQLSLLFSWADYFGLEFPKKGFGKAYYEINSVKERKKVFMDTLYPLIEIATQKILKDRLWIKNYLTIKPLTGSIEFFEHKLSFIDKRYKIKKDKTLQTYMKKVDTINKALVLSQAAVESAWGTSRFTKIANNLFGEWTWGKRGIIPAGRPEGKKYKIKIFDTLQDSVDSYMLNLNRHHSYTSLREARHEKHSQQLFFSGFEAAEHLQAYSGIGDEYGKMLKGVMSYNKMCHYTKKYRKKSKEVIEPSAGKEK